MPTFNINLNGDGAWPDLAAKQAAGKLIHLGNEAVIGVSALERGMASGRASVALRFDLPDGRTVLAETSLRALYTATTALMTKFGEPFMQHPVSDQAHKANLAIQSLTLQLADAKKRLGEPLTLDMTEADETWDRERLFREALAAARSALLAGERPSDTLMQTIDEALLSRRKETKG
jgi:hypothetical protein